MKWIGFLCIVTLLGACAVAAMAAPWSDDFESYTAGNNLPSPWTGNTGVTAKAGTGVGGSQSAWGSNGWPDTYRAADGNTTIIASMLVDDAGTDSSRVWMGFSTGGSIVWSPTGNTVVIMLRYGYDGFPYLAAESDKGDLYSATTEVYLPNSTWIQAKLECNLTAMTCHASYRVLGNTTWLDVGYNPDLTLFPGFAPNYVGIRAGEAVSYDGSFGTIDDLIAVPEPASLAVLLMGLAGLVIRRKK